MDALIFEKRGSVGILQINRPEALNALSGQLMREFKFFLEQLHAKRDTRVLIITGAGEKAFVAGADIRELQGMNAAQAFSYSKLGDRIARLIEIAPFIVIAAVNGYALGGGLELALACDFIYAAKSAKLGLPEVSLGLIPGFGGTQRLARAIGTRRANELIVTGRRLTAQEAFEMGLVNRVVEDKDLLSASIETAEAICKNAHSAVIRAKQAVNRGAGQSLSEGLALEQKLFAACCAGSDAQEGITAFLEKRPAKFS